MALGGEEGSVTDHDQPDPIDVAVGARLLVARRLRKRTLTELGDAIGVTFQQVQRYQFGKNRISASALVRAAEYLGTSVAARVGEGTIGEPDSATFTALQTPGAAELLAA